MQVQQLTETRCQSSEQLVCLEHVGRVHLIVLIVLYFNLL